MCLQPPSEILKHAVLWDLRRLGGGDNLTNDAFKCTSAAMFAKMWSVFVSCHQLYCNLAYCTLLFEAQSSRLNYAKILIILTFLSAKKNDF